MTLTTRYFFRKQDKVKSRKAIDELFSKGNSFSIFPFKVIWLPENKTALLQVAVGVSSKSFKKATERNRIKRLMREAWRLQKDQLQQLLMEQNASLAVFILYTGKELPEYKTVSEKILKILERLSHVSNAKN